MGILLHPLQKLFAAQKSLPFVTESLVPRKKISAHPCFEVRKLVKLQKVHLGNNSLEGRFPEAFCTLDLQVLQLHKNRFMDDSLIACHG